MGRRIFMMIVGLLLLSSPFYASAEKRSFELKAQRFTYRPHILRVNRGDEVFIRLISEDVTHGLYVDGYRVQTNARPGQDGSISFVADKTGRFAFRCSVACGEFHPFMVGYLVVGPNIRFYLFAVLIGLAGAAGAFVVLAKGKGKREEAGASDGKREAVRSD